MSYLVLPFSDAFAYFSIFPKTAFFQKPLKNS